MKKRITKIDMLLKEMGIIQAYSMNELIKRIKTNCGDELAQSIEHCIYQRGDDEEPNDDKIYALMNSTVESSIITVGGFDGGYFKKTLETVIQYPECMGKTVIDIGCNNGLYTCCLAKLFPESHFYGIDLNEQSIIIAREIAKRYDVKNVSFEVCNFRDISGKYDTVFMSKVVHEMVSLDDVNWSMSRENIIKEFTKRFKPIAQSVRKCMSENGCLIAIERIPYYIATFGYVKALCDLGIAIKASECKQIMFSILGDREAMPFIIGIIGEPDMEGVNKHFNDMLDEQERSFYGKM